MDEWRSDPTWRHEQRLFTDGAPTPMVRDEGVESMDIEGARMVATSAGTTAAPPPPVAAVVDDDTRVRPERDRRREPTAGFDDDAWASMGAESSFELHAVTASSGGSSSPAPAAPAPAPGSPGGFIPGDAPTHYEPTPLPPLDEVDDPDIVGAVFPGAAWSAPSAALRNLSSLGPLPDPSAPVADPIADPIADLFGAAAPSADLGAARTVAFADPDVAAERIGWRLATPPAAAGPSVFRQFVSLIVVVAVLGGVVYWQHRPKPVPPVSVPWAAEWDPKVVDLARFVETSRGLLFTNPVAVTFVPADEFDAEIKKGNTADAPAAGPSSKANDPAYVLRQALGLAVDAVAADATTSTDPSSDPSAAGADADPQAGNGSSPVIGRYEPWTHQIRVRGTELTPQVRMTVVHELTHALQDQHFDLAALDAASVTSGSAAALRASVEGDAVAVEDAYLASLDASPAAATSDPTDAGAPDAGTDLATVAVDRPEDNVDVAEQVLDYELAATFVHAVAGRGGKARRDELFTQPETSEASVLFPERQLLNVPLVDVAVPKLDGGDEAVKMHGAPHDVGPYLLALALVRAKLPALTAFEFARGWAGDAYVPFRRGGAPCARIAIQAVEAKELAAVQGALTTWAATRPAGSASVTTDDETSAIVLTACAAVGVPDASPTAEPSAVPSAPPAAGTLSFFELIAFRSMLLVQPFGGSVTVGTMTDRRCLADEAIRYLGSHAWPADDAGRSATAAEAGRQAGLACPAAAATVATAVAQAPEVTAPTNAPVDPNGTVDPTVTVDPNAAPTGNG